jgi:hypothetical protein
MRTVIERKKIPKANTAIMCSSILRILSPRRHKDHEGKKRN